MLVEVMACILEVLITLEAVNPVDIVPVFVDAYIHRPFAFSYILQPADCAFH